MKHYAAIGALAVMTIVFFQNCGQAPNTAETQVTSQAPVGQQYNKFSAETFSTLAIWDFLRNQYLDLNLRTGKVVVFEEAGQVRGETFDLPPEKLSEVQAILSGAEVCEPVVNGDLLKDQVCTMAYRYPYATLVERGEEVKLGEKTDGCDIPVDICGEKAKLLQDWTRSIVESL